MVVCSFVCAKIYKYENQVRDGVGIFWLSSLTAVTNAYIVIQTKSSVTDLKVLQKSPHKIMKLNRQPTKS